MAEVRVPCPNCHSVLKLPNESYLGKKAKCPKCEHRFVLKDPDEVELELVEVPNPAAKPADEVPKVAIPRNPRPAAASPPPAKPAAAVAATTAAASPVPAAPAEPELPFQPDGGFPAFGTAQTEAASPSLLKQHKARRSRGKKTEIIIGGMVALGIAGAVYALFEYQKTNPAAAPITTDKPTVDPNYQAAKASMTNVAEVIASEAPTSGEPITLKMVPAGASIIVHLRPAELWQDGTIGQEVRYCLGPLAEWTGQQIEKYALAPPQEVEEATLCLLLGARGSPVEVACVAKYKTGRKRSELIQKYNAQPTDVDGTQILVSAERAFLFGEESDPSGMPLVLASAPASLQRELAEAARFPGLTSDDIRQILPTTDRQRHFTLVFQPLDLRNREQDLAMPSLQPVWEKALDFLGEQADAVCWSVHFTPDAFDSRLFVRTSPTQTPGEMLKTLSDKLASLPKTLVENFAKMNPAGMGHRKLIGRFPAMMQLFAASTRGGIDDRLVVLQSELPERAGPNMAIAGLLAWDESTRTDFTRVASAAMQPAQAAPKSIAERLKTPVEIDFRREPLEPAFLYIGGEAGVTIEVDGEALKFAGYTKNMPQTFDLGEVPAEKAIAEIVKQYDKMCAAINEAQDKLVITTFAAAQDQGLTPLKFAP